MCNELGVDFIKKVLAEKDTLTSLEIDILDGAVLISKICACSVEVGEVIYCLMKNIYIEPKELRKKLLQSDAELAIDYQEKTCKLSDIHKDKIIP